MHIWNIVNAERFITYAICGQRGSGIFSLNGSAARRAALGDLIIIAAFGWVAESALAQHEPDLMFVDEHNRIREIRSTISEQGTDEHGRHDHHDHDCRRYERKPVTLHRLGRMLAEGQKIAILTAYDCSFARLAEDAGGGLDCLRVGDSLGGGAGAHKHRARHAGRGGRPSALRRRRQPARLAAR